jgi:hypothetical protein
LAVIITNIVDNIVNEDALAGRTISMAGGDGDADTVSSHGCIWSRIDQTSFLFRAQTRKRKRADLV